MHVGHVQQELHVSHVIPGDVNSIELGEGISMKELMMEFATISGTLLGITGSLDLSITSVTLMSPRETEPTGANLKNFVSPGGDI